MTSDCSHNRVRWAPGTDYGKWEFGRVTCGETQCAWESAAVRLGQEVLPPSGNLRWAYEGLPIVAEGEPYPLLHYVRGQDPEPSLWEVALSEMKLIEWAEDLWAQRHKMLDEEDAQDQIHQRENRIREELTAFVGAQRALIMAGKERVKTGDSIPEREIEAAGNLSDQAITLAQRVGYPLAQFDSATALRTRIRS